MKKYDTKEPKLKRDWIGRMVELRHNIELKNGKIFPKGEIMKVAGYYRGLDLETVETCQHCGRGNRWSVRYVHTGSVNLLNTEEDDDWDNDKEKDEIEEK